MTIAHSTIQSADCHEPKHVTNATVADAGKVITPSASTDGVSVLRKLGKADLSDGANIPLREEFQTSDIANPQGWGKYVDSLATPTLTINTTDSKITIDSLGAGQVDRLPFVIRGSGFLWEALTNKITPVGEDDLYLISFTATVASLTSAPLYVKFTLDVGGDVAPTDVLYEFTVPLAGAAPYPMQALCQFHVTADALTNGIQLFAKTNTGSLTLSNREILITRIASGEA